MNKRYGLGFYLGIISVITAMITVVGGFMLGNAFPVIAFSVAGIVLFFVAVKTDLAILLLTCGYDVYFRTVIYNYKCNGRN